MNPEMICVSSSTSLLPSDASSLEILFRAGWTETYLLETGGPAVGFASVVIDGPWKDKRTVLEFYVLPEYRNRAFVLFEAFLATADCKSVEVQSNDVLMTVTLHTFAREIVTEMIVFRDAHTTSLPSGGAVLRCVTPKAETRARLEEQRGATDYVLELSTLRSDLLQFRVITELATTPGPSIDPSPSADADFNALAQSLPCSLIAFRPVWGQLRRR